MPEQIVIAGNEAIAMSPEGQAARMSLAALLARIAPLRMDTGAVTLPHGVTNMIAEGPLTIWVHETAPRPYNLQWIADDSPAPFGLRFGPSLEEA